MNNLAKIESMRMEIGKNQQKIMRQEMDEKAEFTNQLLYWHKHKNSRAMPWKGEPDPYKIWLSEIILQQTRVEQGLSYYIKFTESYPTVNDLANAQDEDVFKKWEGLGYYSRCRNLLFTARLIAKEYGGRFPGDYQKLLKLKGVGPYTAAAIASFGFNLPHAVVDGNVIRVLSRYFLIEKFPDSTEGKKTFRDLADEVLYRNEPGAYNQAIMDFGATVCKPISPDCSNCFMTVNCGAFLNGKTQLLPLKIVKPPKKNRFFAYHLLVYKNEIWISERLGRDIWRHLFEFALIELEADDEWKAYNPQIFLMEKGFSASGIIDHSNKYVQQLTHQKIHTKFFTVKLAERPGMITGGQWVPVEKIRNYAFPGTITRFLEDKTLV